MTTQSPVSQQNLHTYQSMNTEESTATANLHSENWFQVAVAVNNNESVL